MVKLFDGQQGRSFIPLRNATVGLFEKDEYTKNSINFILNKIEELMSVTPLPILADKGVYVIDGENYTTNDILDDLTEVIAFGNTDSGITKSAKEGQNL